MTTPSAARRPVDAVVVGPLEVDYTPAGTTPAEIHHLLADLIPGGLPPAAENPVAAVDEVTITRALAVLRPHGVRAEPAGRALQVATHLAGAPFALRVGVVGAAGTTLSPDLTLIGHLDRHHINHDHVRVVDGLCGTTLTVPAGPHTIRLVYPGANQHLAGLLHEQRDTIAAFARTARRLHAVAPAEAGAAQAVGRFLLAARQANPAVRVSVDLTGRPDPDLAAGLLTLSDVAVVHPDTLTALADPAGRDTGRDVVDRVVSRLRYQQPGLVLAHLDAAGVTIRCPCHTTRTVPTVDGGGVLRTERGVSVVLAHLVAAGWGCQERIAAVRAGLDAAAGGELPDAGQTVPAPPARRGSRWWPIARRRTTDPAGDDQ